VRRSNEWAIHLYEKIGFEFSETLLGSYDDGEDGHVYIKHIGQSDEDIVA
jgi:ribosomal protein S18 acetylase RimI-like enzyme